MYKPVKPTTVAEVKGYYDAKVAESIISDAPPAFPTEEIKVMVADVVKAQPEIAYGEIAPMVGKVMIDQDGITVGDEQIMAKEKRIRATLGTHEVVVKKEEATVTLQTVQGTNAIKVEAPVTIEGDTLSVGDKPIAVLPSVADQGQVDSIVLEQKGKDVVYSVTETKTYKVLGMIPVGVKAEQQFDASTGEEVESAKTPWWGFLSSKPKSAVTMVSAKS
jgi:hypothetical protein